MQQQLSVFLWGARCVSCGLGYVAFLPSRSTNVLLDWDLGNFRSEPRNASGMFLKPFPPKYLWCGGQVVLLGLMDGKKMALQHP